MSALLPYLKAFLDPDSAGIVVQYISQPMPFLEELHRESLCRELRCSVQLTRPGPIFQGALMRERAFVDCGNTSYPVAPPCAVSRYLDFLNAPVAFMWRWVRYGFHFETEILPNYRMRVRRKALADT